MQYDFISFAHTIRSATSTVLFCHYRMYGAFAYPELSCCLTYGSIIFYNIGGDCHCPILNLRSMHMIFFHKNPPDLVFV